jgi:hypothetical protein
LKPTKTTDFPKPTGKATNRQFEELHPDKQINWWRSKETYCYHLSQANKIIGITPQKISMALGIDMEIDKGYCEHLCAKVEEFRRIRRINSIKSRHTDKENKKIILRKLLREHPATNKKGILELFNNTSEYKLSRMHFSRLLKEIEAEKMRPQEIQIITNFCHDLDMFIETKRMLKEIKFNELPNYKKGNYRKMNSLLKNININILLYYHNFEFTNVTFLSEEEIMNTKDYIDWETDDLDFNYDLTSPDFFKRADKKLKFLKELQDDVDIGMMMIKYKKKLIAKGII